MSDAWRIDSLDARAGLAFASWRPADLATDDPRLDYRTVFLSAPAFRPEVASRATGLAASRGHAQLGVFLGDDELAFATLEALIEFVRRLYLSGGGGDGGVAGGGGRRPVPPRPETGGDFPEPKRASDENGRAWDLVGAGRTAAQLAASLPVPTDAPIETASFYFTPPPPLPEPGRALAEGASELLVELLRRHPKPQPADTHQVWWDAARRLGAAIGGLGLWEWILFGPGGDLFDEIAAGIAASLDLSDPADRWLIALLFDPEIGGFAWREPKLEVRQKLYGGYPLTARRANGESDPVEDLCLWPLAGDLAADFGAPDAAEAGRATAYHLLSAALGSPGRLAQASGARAAGVMLFSTAHILAGGGPPFGATSLGAHFDAYARIEDEALRWIARQWPTLIFPSPVEQLIADAVAIPDA